MNSMNTKQKLESDLKDAMRSNNEIAKRTIRLALASMKLAEVDKGGPLDEQSVQSILQKEIKGRRETILDAEKAGRPDLAATAQQEIAFLESYLPKGLTSAELFTLASAAVEEVQAQSPADMGKVMKVLLPRVQGRAPGDQVSQAVRQILQAK